MAEKGAGGLLRRCLSRWTASSEAQEAAELQESVQRAGFDPIERCADRERVRLSGTLRTVTLCPRAGSPTLEAELYDGSGTVTLVWLGRRRIAGIEPGRGIVVSGRIAVHDNRRIMYNPRYELSPQGAA
jgi:hypothetical protein